MRNAALSLVALVGIVASSGEPSGAETNRELLRAATNEAGAEPLRHPKAAARPPEWPVEARLFGSDQAVFWSFSQDVALDGGTALVGASGADIGANEDQGAAYVFVREGDTWVEQAQLLAHDGAPDDSFGWSVALDGDTAVVGARLADGEGPLEENEGAVYVYFRVGTEWFEATKLVASDGGDIDYFGYSVAIDGDTLIAGAPNAQAGDGSDGSGAAYVFIKQGVPWLEEAKLFDPEASFGSAFGSDVALRDGLALVGDPNASIDGDAGRGAAYVYVDTGGSWELEEKLLASDGEATDTFGNSVALDRDVALIGAEQKDLDGNPRQGAAYLFRRSGTTWTEEQRLTASNGQAEGSFGIGAALLDGVALVGAQIDSPGNPEQGVVYEYRHQGASWLEIQRFAAPEGHGLDSFGEAIALTRDGALISHRGESVLPPPGGSAWVFGRPVLFEDGFESGGTSAWDQTVQ